MAGASRDPQFCVHIKQMRRRTDKGQPDCVTWGQNHPLAQDANDLALVVSCDKIGFCARRFDRTDSDWKSAIVINRYVFGADRFKPRRVLPLVITSLQCLCGHHVSDTWRL